MTRRNNRRRKQKKSAKQKQIFRLPENRGNVEPPRDSSESLCWVLASICDFKAVNQLAESLQIARAPQNSQEIRKNREIIIREGNKLLDLRATLEIARAYQQEARPEVIFERENVDEIEVEPHELTKASEKEMK